MAMVLNKSGESKVRDSELHRIVLQKLSGVNRVLDIGCGDWIEKCPAKAIAVKEI